MRKIITISFLGIYLLGNTEVGQLVNLPKLFDHYHQHHFLQPNVSFVSFIAMHYMGDDGMTSDDQQDQELPFKQIHKPFSTINFEVPNFTSFNSNTLRVLPDSFKLFKEPFPQSGFFSLPLRPPELQS